ncbi:MAG: hypothetical protein MZV63_61615 [Marinilabiliales bacterium]|nr:hypothetical protein [Marinilabiliales bacterium]
MFRPEFAFVPVDYEFRIYSRTGALLFQTSDYATGWDGRHNGIIASFRCLPVESQAYHSFRQYGGQDRNGNHTA